MTACMVGAAGPVRASVRHPATERAVQRHLVVEPVQARQLVGALRVAQPLLLVEPRLHGGRAGREARGGQLFGALRLGQRQRALFGFAFELHTRRQRVLDFRERRVELLAEPDDGFLVLRLRHLDLQLHRVPLDERQCQASPSVPTGFISTRSRLVLDVPACPVSVKVG